MLGGYLKVVNDLTINEENRLRLEVQKLQVHKDKLDVLEEKMQELNRRLGLE
jgi:hypothetical protein